MGIVDWDRDGGGPEWLPLPAPTPGQQETGWRLEAPGMEGLPITTTVPG